MHQVLRHIGVIPFCLAAFALFGAPSLGVAGTIYVSYDANGDPHYASRPYDSTYKPFLVYASPSQGEATRKPKGIRVRGDRQTLEPAIMASARKFDVDPALLRAVIHTESAFDAKAVSPKGAVGAMQIMPATAMRYGGGALTDPATNIAIGARHLGLLLKRYGGNLGLALAAYNSGEGAVTRNANRIPPYRETMLYVPEVLARYSAYRQDSARLPANVRCGRPC